MSFQFVDGFDSYAATADLTKKWTNAGNATWNSSAGRLGGGAIQFSNTNAANINVNVWPNGKFSANLYLGWWFKASSKPSSTQTIFALLNNGLTFTGGLQVTAGGVVQLTTQGGTNDGNGVINVCDNNWHWFEFQFQLAAQNTAGGLFQVYVDTQQEVISSGNNVGGFNVTGDARYLSFNGLAGTALTATFDDIYCHDNGGNAPTGGSFPYGPRVITTRRPNSDSAVVFTPTGGTGTNNSCVNEVNADDDTSYVQDGTSGDQDLYGFGALPFTPNNITGSMLSARLKDPGAGTINYQLVGKSGGTTRLGTSTVTPSNYTKVVQMEFGLDPNTSAAWTPTNLNAALFGIHVV